MRRNYWTLVAAAARIGLFSASASAATIYVDISAPEGGNGGSWVMAFQDLQNALAVAQSGDEIWVAAGTYRPGNPGASRDSSFVLKSNVAIYGGFSGTESELGQRDPFFNPTTLSGDLNGDDVSDFMNRADNCYHVVFALDVVDARLDGLTISGGYADGVGIGPEPESRDQGSGVNVFRSNPLLFNCLLTDNYASNHGSVNDHGNSTVINCVFEANRSGLLGAGLYSHHDSMTYAEGCSFRFNHAAQHGAGAYFRSMHGARIVNCSFFGNTALQGAGLFNAEDSAVHIDGCTFAENTAQLSGGGFFAEQAMPMLDDCNFVENAAGLGVQGGDGGGGGSGGGGVWFTGGAGTLRNCRFLRNFASLGGGAYNIEDARTLYEGCLFALGEAHEAGGMYSLGSPATILNCTFAENRAFGGEFSVGGGLTNYFSSTNVIDCVFERNSAGLGGGGMYNEGSTPRVRGCKFFGNESLGAGQGWGGGLMNGYFTDAVIANCVFSGNRSNLGGGAFQFAFSRAVLVNCTFASNLANQGGGLYFNYLHESTAYNCTFGFDTPDEIAGVPGTLEYSCVAGGYAGLGNISATPAFMDRLGSDGQAGNADDDLRLAAGSAGIDAGDSSRVPNWDGADADGLPRRVDDPVAVDGGAGGWPIVDMGAYEFRPGNRCFGDADTDGFVALSDLAILLAHFGQTSGANESDGDLDLDADVDVQDLAWLLRFFGRACP